jgi:hypothetical protein
VQANLSAPKYVAYMLYKTLFSGSEYIKNHKDELVSNLDFKKEISKNLSSETFTSDPQFDELITLWNNVNSYTFSKENNIIASLEKNNTEKFDLVKDIINTEIAKNKKMKEDFKNSFESSIKKVSLGNNSSIEEYNLRLEEYNETALKNLSNLLNYDENNSAEKEIKIA